jgi:hypothetical protein
LPPGEKGSYSVSIIRKKYRHINLILILTLYIINGLKINLFTPAPEGSKLIFFAPLGEGVIEENQLGELNSNFQYYAERD